jgi:Zn-dependent alcohol dehydrogenase
VSDVAARAAVLRAFGTPQSVEEVRLRRPGPGEALVRMGAAGVCHSDVGQADGKRTFGCRPCSVTRERGSWWTRGRP